jgi:hypothetical protein
MPQQTLNVALFALIVPLLCAPPAAAQLINEVRKLNATDGESFDRFGESVALSGNTALVGAPLEVVGGAAYLFDITTGQQLFKLKGSDTASSDNFGSSVAISGNIAIVGAPQNDTNDTGGASTDAGAAYVFDTTTGLQLFKLTALDARPSDNFGSSLAISGNIAIIGAPGNDGNGPASETGAAYLFNVATGQQIRKLVASDAGLFDQFGFAVDISPTRAIVGARFDDDVFGGSGSAYIFDTSMGQQLFKLNASDPGVNDWFGFVVGISGTTAIVGAPQNDDAAPNSNSGSAYLFDIITGQQLSKLTASDAASGDVFGYAVSISGTTAIVGAYLNDDHFTFDNGLIYAFDTTTGQELFRLGASDAANNDRLGESVAISGSTIIAGAYQDDDVGVNSGSAYVFQIADPCPADLTGDGVLNFFDLAAFIALFNAGDPAADLAAPFGVFNFFDLAAYVASYNVGCP